MFLENLYKLEKSLWNSHVEFMGVDNDLAEMYAEDRNDVIRCKELFQVGKLNQLNNKLNHLDTHIREGIVVAFAKDLGEEWVMNALGYEVR